MGLAHLRSRDLPAAVEDLLAASRALPEDAAIRAALDEALERLLEPTPEERAASESALDGMVRGGEWLAGPDPFAAPDEVEAAALAELLRDVTDSCVEPPELAFVEWRDADPGLTAQAPSSDAGDAPTGDAAERERMEEHLAAYAAAPDDEPAPREQPEVEVAPATAVLVGSHDDGPPAVSPKPARRASWDERQLDLHRLRRSLVAPGIPGQPSAATSTVMMRKRRSGTRRTAVWTSVFALLGAAAFGTVVTQRSAGDEAGGGSARPATARSDAPREAALAGEPAPRNGEGATSVPARPAGAATPAAASPLGAVTAGAPTDSAGADPETTLPPAADPSYEAAPRYDFMARLGLPAPPGGVIDPANSETGRLMDEGLEGRPARPIVLTFRTRASVEEVTAWYAERLPRVCFNARVVPMGGPFQGVQRTVARASTQLPRGHRIVLTVSRPGVNTTSRKLVPETTVRMEIR